MLYQYVLRSDIALILAMIIQSCYSLGQSLKFSAVGVVLLCYLNEVGIAVVVPPTLTHMLLLLLLIPALAIVTVFYPTNPM